jgi:glycylpeptide N-tetradecanoyltransferase
MSKPPATGEPDEANMTEAADAEKSREEIHKFWSTQPVPKRCPESGEILPGPLEAKSVGDIQKEPLSIASTFEWWMPDITSDCDLQSVHELLRDNYVEDDDSIFRFNYSVEFLRWALTPPGYVPEWHIGVRRRSDKKLLAFIAGVPLVLTMGNTPAADAKADGRKICEINFLCVHKGLRAKRLAPILIREVTRRVNCLDIWQAVYTAGVVLPTPFASAQYFHRNLNPEKLVAIRFSRIPAQFEKFQKPMEAMKRSYAIPSKPVIRGMREMTAADIPVVTVMLERTLSPLRVRPVFDEADVMHWMLPRPGVIYSYVVENPSTKAVTDFVSFYNLPSTVIGCDKYSDLKAAYTFYYSANTVPLKVLINDMLVFAKQHDFDVCNTLDIMSNGEFLQELKFGPGDGKLNYYFYNWGFPAIKPSEIGLVML